MSLAACDECNSFIDTDADPNACLAENFLCESCREDKAIDDHIHETINELRIQNAKLIRAINSFLKDVDTDYKENGEYIDQPNSLILNNYDNFTRILTEYK